MILIPRKVIFVHVPKTGGNSIKKMLTKKTLDHDPNEKDIGHNTMQKIIDYYPEYSEFRKVFVVRNPYDRIISFYFYTKKGHKHNSNVFNRDEFLNFLYVEKKNYLKTQTERVSVNGKIDTTFMIRFETFEEDVRRVFRDLGIDIKEIPKLNTTDHEHYSRYLDPELREIITAKFQEDLDNFGYEFKNKRL